MTQKWRNFFVMVMAAIISLLTTGAARAEAPANGYAILEKTKTGDTVILVGVGLTVEHVLRDFGPEYKKSTGKDLTWQVLYAVEANHTAPGPNSSTPTIPVCGGSFTSSHSASVWDDCPEANKHLGFVAHMKIVIPGVRVLTRDEKFAELEKENADLKAQLAKGSSAVTTTPAPVPTQDTTALTSANAKITELEKQLAEAKAQPAPAPIAPTTLEPSQRKSPWILAIFVLALAMGAFIIFYAKWYKPLKDQVRVLELKDEDAKEVIRDQQNALDASRKTVFVFNSLVNQFMIGEPKSEPNDDGKAMIITRLIEGLRKENDRMGGDLVTKDGTIRDLQGQVNAANQRAAQIEKNLKAADADLEIQRNRANVAEDSARTYHEQIQTLNRTILDLTRDATAYTTVKVERQAEAQKRKEFAEVSTQLKALIMELFLALRSISEATNEIRTQQRILQEYGAEPPEEVRLRLEQLSQKKFEAEKTKEDLFAKATPLLKQFKDLHKQITGIEPDVMYTYLIEASSLREEAASDRAAAAEALTTARAKEASTEDALRQATEMLQRQIGEGEVLEADKAKLNGELQKFAEDQEAFAARQSAWEHAQGEQMRSIQHLLGSSLENLGYDPAMPIEEILKLNGSSGILFEASKRTKDAEARAQDAEAAHAQHLTACKEQMEAKDREIQQALDATAEVRRDAEAITAQIDAELTELKRKLDDAEASFKSERERADDLQKVVDSQTAEIESYAQLQKQRDQRSASPPVSEDSRDDEPVITGSYERAPFFGATPTQPVSPVMEDVDPDDIPRPSRVPDEFSRETRPGEYSIFAAHADDDAEDPGLDPVPPRRPEASTIRGTPQRVLEVAADLKRTLPPAPMQDPTKPSPTNGSGNGANGSGPKRHTTLGGLGAANADYLEKQYMALMDALSAINVHQAQTREPHLLKPELTQQLGIFLRSGWKPGDDVLHYSPIGAVYWNQHPELWEKYKTIADIPRFMEKMSVKFPAKTLRPPSVHPNG